MVSSLSDAGFQWLTELARAVHTRLRGRKLPIYALGAKPGAQEAEYSQGCCACLGRVDLEWPSGVYLYLDTITGHSSPRVWAGVLIDRRGRAQRLGELVGARLHEPLMLPESRFRVHDGRTFMRPRLRAREFDRLAVDLFDSGAHGIGFYLSDIPDIGKSPGTRLVEKTTRFLVDLLDALGEDYSGRSSAGTHKPQAARERRDRDSVPGKGDRSTEENRSTSKAALASRLARLSELETQRRTAARREQDILRSYLLGGAQTGTCAVCGQTFPVELLVAGHIKRRTKCTDRQKKDTTNLMLVCTFGCDALFERGYIVVRRGKVAAGPNRVGFRAVSRRVSSLKGKPCSNWSTESAGYFEWHEKSHQG
jgi:hypothetical protein